MFEKSGKNTNKEALPKFPLKEMGYTIRNTRYISNACVGFSLDIKGLVLYNLRLVDGKNGLFLAMPSDKGSDGNYYPKYNLYLTEEDSKELFDKVVEAYNSTSNGHEN